MNEHMRWCYDVSSYNFTKPPLGSSYKLTYDTCLGLYEITYKIRPSVRIICNKV
jgi:hypothetical protein